jgi:DNA-binding NarL/FixJ family response regulator
MNLSVRLRNDLNCGICDSENNPQLTSRSRVDIVKGDSLETSSVRVLVVEDSEEFRKFICSMLGERPELQIVGEESDGLRAFQRADELQPDLILLDIGLPSLNGIEVARQVFELSPKSKILFLSQEFSTDVVREALSTGALGYVVKMDAGSELPTAVETVLRGERYVGSRLDGLGLREAPGAAMPGSALDTKASGQLQRQNMEIPRRHEVGFYPDDATLLVDLTQFIGTALKAEHGAVIVATESHRNGLLRKLEAHGVDIAAAIDQGRYISVDAADALSAFMVNRTPDPARFLKLFGDLIVTVAAAAKREQARVAVFGEGVQLLWAQGNAEAAIQVERLTNRIGKTHDVDILCGYSLGTVQGEMDSHIFQGICKEHSAVYPR